MTVSVWRTSWPRSRGSGATSRTTGRVSTPAWRSAAPGPSSSHSRSRAARRTRAIPLRSARPTSRRHRPASSPSAAFGQVDEHQRASLDGAQPRRLACEVPPVEEDHRFADGQFLGYLTDRCQRGRWQPVEQVIGDRFPVPLSHPRPRGRPPGRSRRLPGLPGPGQARPCRRSCRGPDQGGCPRRFRGNVRRNCVWRHRRVGLPRLTCGRDRNKIPYAQVKAKREDLPADL
jgi:hypothetical protein